MEPDWGGTPWVTGATAEAKQKGGRLGLSERCRLASGLSLAVPQSSPERKSSRSGAEARKGQGLGLNHTAPCLSQESRPFWRSNNSGNNSESYCPHLHIRKWPMVTQPVRRGARIITKSASQMRMAPHHCLSLFISVGVSSPSQHVLRSGPRRACPEGSALGRGVREDNV